jgi:hypothetical protein
MTTVRGLPVFPGMWQKRSGLNGRINLWRHSVNPFNRSVGWSLRIVLPFLMLLIFISPPARADWGVEITPFAGFRFGGGFEDNTTGLDLDVDEGESFGLILDVRATHETEYELFYSVQKTELQGDGLFWGENPSSTSTSIIFTSGGPTCSREKEQIPSSAGGSA